MRGQTGATSAPEPAGGRPGAVPATRTRRPRTAGEDTMKLEDKIGLLPGASRPLGRAIARRLRRAGCRLVLPSYDDWPESAKEMAEEFGGAGHLVIEADLRRQEDVARLAAAVDRAYGRLDFLVLNIERGGMPVLHGDYTLPVNRDQFRLELETTLTAKWLLMRYCLPLLRRPPEAAVVVLSSVAGEVGRAGPAGLLFNDGFAAANRGISLLTQTWARMGAPTVRVNELVLGLIEHRHGPGTRGWALLTEEERRRLLGQALLQRPGTVEEVAAMVQMLLDTATYMTGAVIRYDGGFALGGQPVWPMPDGVLAGETGGE